MNKMKIALLGFDFSSPNKGCEALAYSFVNMISELNIDKIELHVFGSGELGVIPQRYPNITFVGHRLRMKRPNYWVELLKMFKRMDCIFDITFGDGFSDIYGKLWNANTDMAKEIAIRSGVPFVLLPQTYGPYASTLLKYWAANIVKRATKVFSRDELSAAEMRILGCKNVIVTTDLAFALPYNKTQYSISGDRLKVGLNVSSLLWDGGHNIKLKTDYKDFCREIVKKYSISTNAEVHLIPHVIDKKNPSALENDSRICRLLKQEFSDAILAPDFESPIDAKSYISNMDVFIGARMHSTIGAMSSGVPAIPFSYSKKFEGLYGNLQYPYIISATQLDTLEAINLVEKYISERDKLEEARKAAMSKIDKQLEIVRGEIKKLIIN